MNSNMNSVGIGFDTVSQLTQLLTTFGIYTLVVFFMFYLLHKTGASLDKCKAADREYYQKINKTVLWTTIVFCIVAAGVWIYTNFVYQPRVLIEGTIKDLTEQPKRPVRFGDPPMVLHRVAAFRGDVTFYSFERPSMQSDSVDLGWAVVSSSGPKVVQLVLQKQYCLLDQKKSNEALTVNSGQEDLTPRASEGIQLKMASLDLNVHKSLLGQQIQFVYRPDTSDPIRNLGRLYAADGDKFIPIPWVDYSQMENSPIQKSSAQSLLFGTGLAWAETPRQQQLGNKVEMGPEVVQRIRQYLGSDELDKQLAAQAVLVENGGKSFPYIIQMLQDKQEEARSRSLLIHNLATVVDRIEKTGAHAPSDLNLLLGDALYVAGDSSLAASYFGKVPESQPLPAGALLNRSLVMLDTKHLDEAARGLQKYYETVKAPADKSVALSNLGVVSGRRDDTKQAREYFRKAVALNPNNLTAQFNLGLSEKDLGNLSAAASAFERAAQLNPKDTTARIQLAIVRQSQGELKESAKILEEVVQSDQDPRALNNLAYVYALQGEKLDRALSYVEQAIKLGGETASRLDTKGWVLYKMGDRAQGLDYLKRALAKEPTNRSIQKHLEEVQGAITAQKR